MWSNVCQSNTTVYKYTRIFLEVYFLSFSMTALVIVVIMQRNNVHKCHTIVYQYICSWNNDFFRRALITVATILNIMCTSALILSSNIIYWPVEYSLWMDAYVTLLFLTNLLDEIRRFISLCTLVYFYFCSLK